MKNRKSCALARFLSILIPGLGLIYVGEFLKGIIYMLPGFIFVSLEWYIFKLILKEYYAGSRVLRGVDALVIIAIGYFLYSSYSAKEASQRAAQFNMREALFEEENDNS